MLRLEILITQRNGPKKAVEIGREDIQGQDEVRDGKKSIELALKA